MRGWPRPSCCCRSPQRVAVATREDERRQRRRVSATIRAAMNCRSTITMSPSVRAPQRTHAPRTTGVGGNDGADNRIRATSPTQSAAIAARPRLRADGRSAATIPDAIAVVPIAVWSENVVQTARTTVPDVWWRPARDFRRGHRPAAEHCPASRPPKLPQAEPERHGRLAEPAARRAGRTSGTSASPPTGARSGPAAKARPARGSRHPSASNPTATAA